MTGRFSQGSPSWVVAATSVAFILVFLGERVFPTIGWLREGLSGIGVAGVLALTVLRWIAAFGASGERRSVERALATLSTVGAIAILVYFTTAEPFTERLGIMEWPLAARDRYEAVATVLWTSLIVGSWLPMLFAERALYPMRRAAAIESRRVRDAMAAGLILGLAAVYGALFCFAAGELDVRADFSYFRTARPSESTRRIAASATEPLHVIAFFPQPNPVGDEVVGYLRDLAKGLPNLQVEAHDRLLVPQIARDAKVLYDGVVVLERGPQREAMSVGVDMQEARPKLKTLDADFQKSLVKVLRQTRTAYFTVGHGELNDAQPTKENDGRTGKGIREILEEQNYVIHDLSAATGLGVDVPADATLVVVLGPEHPFLPEEVQSLERYAQHGGRLFLCLDPEPKIDLAPLAGVVGLTVSSAVLANERVHMRRRFNDSDRTILATNRFSSHASVSTLSRLGSRPVFLRGAGSLDRKTGTDPGLQIDFAVRALPDTFHDDNGDFTPQPSESRGPYPVAAAVSKRVAPPSDGSKKRSDELRAFVIGDADAVSDAALANEANVLLIADAAHWLTGEESFAGALATTEDVRIEHTKQKDLIWFYGTIVGAPALVLGLGLLYARRVRRAARRRASSRAHSPSAPRGPEGVGAS